MSKKCPIPAKKEDGRDPLADVQSALLGASGAMMIKGASEKERESETEKEAATKKWRDEEEKRRESNSKQAAAFAIEKFPKLAVLNCIDEKDGKWEYIGTYEYREQYSIYYPYGGYIASKTYNLYRDVKKGKIILTINDRSPPGTVCGKESKEEFKTREDAEYSISYYKPVWIDIRKPGGEFEQFKLSADGKSFPNYPVANDSLKRYLK